MNPSTNKILYFIFLSLTILTIAFIFSNSLKNGEESNAQSKPIVEVVEAVLDPKDKVPTTIFNYFVRKAAHLTEFAMLGFTLAGQICCVQKLTGHPGGKQDGSMPKKRRIAAGMLFGLMIAAADEIIQRFTSRTSSITDVMIDFVGVILGMTLVLIVYRLCERRKR